MKKKLIALIILLENEFENCKEAVAEAKEGMKKKKGAIGAKNPNSCFVTYLKRPSKRF